MCRRTKVLFLGSCLSLSPENNSYLVIVSKFVPTLWYFVSFVELVPEGENVTVILTEDLLLA